MPKENQIEVVRDGLSLKIYINKLLHLELRMNNHDGIQAWLEGSSKHMYFIEFYREEGDPVLLEYDEVDIWETILKLLDKNI